MVNFVEFEVDVIPKGKEAVEREDDAAFEATLSVTTKTQYIVRSMRTSRDM